MKNRLFLAVLIICLVALPYVAGAQDGPPGPPDGPRGAAMQKFRTIRIAELQEALNLDEKTTIKVNAVLIKNDKDRDAVMKDMRDRMRELRALAASEKPDDAKITSCLDKLLDLKNRMQSTQMQELKELRQILTPSQQAKFVIMTDKFRKKMHKAIKKSWMERGAGGEREPGPHGPGDGPGAGPGGMPPPPPDDDE